MTDRTLGKAKRQTFGIEGWLKNYVMNESILETGRAHPRREKVRSSKRLAFARGSTKLISEESIKPSVKCKYIFKWFFCWECSLQFRNKQETLEFSDEERLRSKAHLFLKLPMEAIYDWLLIYVSPKVSAFGSKKLNEIDSRHEALGVNQMFFVVK